jgi:hypothetical protein
MWTKQMNMQGQQMNRQKNGKDKGSRVGVFEQQVDMR